jgi:iron complex outermembrane recepter protein
MKTNTTLALLGGWLALALAPGSLLHAATSPTAEAAQNTASITGRVQSVVTGQYLNNARVTLRGTDIVVFTDESGTYRLPRVPPGSVTIEVFHTGLDPQVITVQVAPGDRVVRDVDLTSAARFGPGEVVKLDAFTVSTARETDAEAIAINEQRFAPNLKTVMAADSLGDVMDGNAGEFLKFMPGITAEYDNESGGTVVAISVRGFADTMTSVTVDGAQMANQSTPTGNSRGFQFNQVSINNVSRFEVTKVPTPSSPADSLAGSVNMVSKSAFERKSAQLKYRTSISTGSRTLTFKRVPHTDDRRIYAVRPNLDFDYTLPINRNLGIVLTGLSTHRYGQQHYSATTWNAGGTATGASFAQPFFQSHRLVDAPRLNTRNSVALRVDWRVTPNSVLSVGSQASFYRSSRVGYEWLVNAGTNANPTPSTGQRMSFGPDFTYGATGRGSVTLGGSSSVMHLGETFANNVIYRFDNGTWRVEAKANQSTSEGGFRDTKYGHFRQFGIAMREPVRVEFTGISPDRPGQTRIFDNSNREIDMYDLRSYRLNTARSTPRFIVDEFQGANLDVRRQVNLLPFPAAVQTGGAIRRQTRDIRRNQTDWTYAGVDGDFSPLRFAPTRYLNQNVNYGYNDMPRVSPARAWEAFQRDPSLFYLTPAQVVAQEQFRVMNSEYIKETVSAGYLQGEMRLWRNRLQVLGGVRYEKTEDLGKGPLFDPNAVFVRNPDGSFARTPGGARIRKPEAGAAGSMEELRLTRQERAFVANPSYDGFYPSLHFTLQARENMLVRLAYASTYGRPNFTDIIPNSTINEADIDADVSDPTQIPGSITVRNTGLKPWSAHNYDLSLEYYTQQGGVFSAGVFLKEISDFFGNEVRIATAQDLALLGLDPRYVGWNLSTKFNSGDARVTGMEFNAVQSLQALGGWARHFRVFVNGTKLQLAGDKTADFTRFIKQSVNWGFTYARNPVTFTAKWNHRGRQKRSASPGYGPDGYEYNAPRNLVDLNMDYQLTRRLTLFANAQNIFNEPVVDQRYSSVTPAYARQRQTQEYGIQFALGVKGTF